MSKENKIDKSEVRKKNVICVDKDGNKTEVSADELVFRPSVYGIILRDDRVLLVPQWDGYDFPGGGIEPGETLDEAFEREIKEETGLSVSRGAIVAAASNLYVPTHTHREEYWQGILLYFLCENVQGEISTDGFDAGEQEYARQAEWIPIEKLSSLKFYNAVDTPRLVQKAARLKEEFSR